MEEIDVMAEETNNNIQQEFNSATIGLNMDQSSNQIGKGQLTYSLNALVENFDATSVNYQNELGNTICINFPYGYTYNGGHSIPEQNKHLFFLVNSETEDSEIGYMDNNDCVYHTLINAKCLNFKKKYPIHKVVHKITNCSTQIFFTDAYNNRRYLDLNNIPYKLSSSSDLCNPSYTNEVDCNRLSLQPNFSIPELKVVDVNIGGALTAGTVQFTAQYSDVNGSGYSSYYSVTNPTPIANPNITTPNFDYTVGKSVDVKISNLDTSGQWQYFNLAVIKTVNGISSVELVGTYFIDSPEKIITYTGQNQTQIKLSINDVFEKYPYYDVANDLTVVQDILVWDGLTSIDRINYQKIANGITLQWQSYRIPNTENYSDELNATNLRGYVRDEVYSYEFVPLLRNGKQLDGFHIPARQANSNDLVLVPTTNADFVGEPDFYTGNIGYSPYWKIYNTASVEGISPEYSSDLEYKGNYQYGNFSYWESTERYPCDEKVWGDLANQPIRHHKFPDTLISPIFESAFFTSASSMVMQKDAIFPIGVKVDVNQIISLINTSDLTQEQKDNIVGFKIVRGDRGTNKSVLAKGILRNVGKYTREETEYYYPNYPYNDLSEDPFLLSQSNAYTSNSNISSLEGCKRYNVTITSLAEASYYFSVQYTNCYTNLLETINRTIITEDTLGEQILICSLTEPEIIRGEADVTVVANDVTCIPDQLDGFASDDSRYRTVFNSPETSFGQPFLGNVLKLENIIFGAGKAHFVQVKDNSLYKMISREAQEDALNSANEIANITSPYNASALFAAYQAYLTIYINGITRRNYGYSFNSIASYDYSADVNNNVVSGDGYTGVKQRPIEIAQYLIPGVQNVGDDNNINNYQRESSVYIKTTDDSKELTKTYITYRICNNNVIPGNQIFQYTDPVIGTTSITISYLSCNNINSFTYPVLTSGNTNYLITSQSTSTITQTTNTPPLPFPSESPSFTSMSVEDDSRFVLSEVGNCDNPEKQEDINVVSYYASMKTIFPNQWGQIYSYETIDTGFQVNLLNPPAEATMFGGDTFINKFAFKTKLPFFIDNRVGAPDDSDIYYDEIGNVAYPKYWYSSRSVLIDVEVEEKELKNFISVKAHNLDCPNTQTPEDSPGRTFYDGKMYLFAYGIPYFYCETSYNVDLRQAFNNKEGDFWPHVSTGIPDDWVQESYVSIANDNTYYYNVTYSKQNKENLFTHLPLDFTNDQCSTYFPFKAIYSDPQITDTNNKVNNWLIYRASSYFDFPQNYGDLISLDGIQNKAVLARFENKSLLYNTMLTINTSNPQAAYLGNDTLFKSAPPIDFAETDLGYVGTQHKFLLKIPQGPITIDAKRGQVFLISGNKAMDLCAFGSGMNKFFTNHLSFEILKYFPEINIDNNFSGIGLHGVYDSRFNRIIITKLDYIPKSNSVIYDEELDEFYIQETYNEQIINKQIYLQDEDYFCNRSWTVSYSFNTRSWISFHSYLPNYYIGENNFFYSGMNNCCSDIEAIVAEVVAQPSTSTTTSTSSTSTSSTTSTSTTVYIGCNFSGTATERFCNLYGIAQEAYGNHFKSQSFQRNNCLPGYTGTSSVYSVPENTYYAPTQSGADALAQQDINENGQNYANDPAHGSCIINNPNAFDLIDQTGLNINSLTESNSVPVTGSFAVYVISVVNGEYQIDGGSWTSANGTVNVGSTVKVRRLTSGSYSTTVSATLTIGSISDIWNITTMAPPPTTTTTSTTASPIVNCLEGLVIETIYLNSTTDLDLLPPEYIHPCQGEIGSHTCNRALFEVFGNGVYLGDSRLNNNNGVGGGTTSHGTSICQDYDNTPDALVGGTWTGSSQSRYNKITLDLAQATAVVAASGGSSIVTFDLTSAMTTYSATCDSITSPHDNITWVRITSPSGSVLFNGCPEGNFATIDVCSPSTTTTSTSSYPGPPAFSCGGSTRSLVEVSDGVWEAVFVMGSTTGSIQATFTVTESSNIEVIYEENTIFSTSLGTGGSGNFTFVYLYNSSTTITVRYTEI